MADSYRSGQPAQQEFAAFTFQMELKMARLTTAVRSFIRKDDGAALVEYGILVALIAVVCIVIVAVVGNKISAKFSEINAKLT